MLITISFSLSTYHSNDGVDVSWMNEENEYGGGDFDVAHIRCDCNNDCDSDGRCAYFKNGLWQCNDTSDEEEEENEMLRGSVMQAA